MSTDLLQDVTRALHHMTGVLEKMAQKQTELAEQQTLMNSMLKRVLTDDGFVASEAEESDGHGNDNDTRSDPEAVSVSDAETVTSEVQPKAKTARSKRRLVQDEAQDVDDDDDDDEPKQAKRRRRGSESESEGVSAVDKSRLTAFRRVEVKSGHFTYKVTIDDKEMDISEAVMDSEYADVLDAVLLNTSDVAMSTAAYELLQQRMRALARGDKNTVYDTTLSIPPPLSMAAGRQCIRHNMKHSERHFASEDDRSCIFVEQI